jgi:integrase
VPAFSERLTFMASISTDSGGNVRIMFAAPGGGRKTIYLGKVSKKVAAAVKLRVESLVGSIAGGAPVDPQTAAWTATVSDDLAAKLAAVGLMAERQSQKLRPFLDQYIGGRATDGHTKPATLVTIRRVADDLVTALGAGTDMRDVTVESAERFKRFYQDKEHAPATTYRRLKMAKILFGYAAKVKLIGENPFLDVKGKNTNPPERQQYVAEADTRRMIDVANPTWRTIVALARFGGLRCPSEVLSLKWENVDLPRGRMTVSSPKTEHLDGRAYRVVPIFARLRPFLEDAWELAAPGEVYVVGGRQGDHYRETSQKPGGWVNTNLRTTFEKLVRRAGLVAWPRLFQNLRASLETDLMKDHPIHVVTAWVGNTPKIALGHYLQTLEGDFEKAVRGDATSDAPATQKPTQTRADVNDPDGTPGPEVLADRPVSPVLSAPVSYCPDVQVAKVGLEPTRFYPLDFESSASAIPPLGPSIQPKPAPRPGQGTDPRPAAGVRTRTPTTPSSGSTVAPTAPVRREKRDRGGRHSARSGSRCAPCRGCRPRSRRRGPGRTAS